MHSNSVGFLSQLWLREKQGEMGALSLFISLEPKLSIPDFVLQLWRKSYKTKPSKAWPASVSPQPTAGALREAANLWTGLCAVHDGVTTEDRERIGHIL